MHLSCGMHRDGPVRLRLPARGLLRLAPPFAPSKLKREQNGVRRVMAPKVTIRLLNYRHIVKGFKSIFLSALFYFFFRN